MTKGQRHGVRKGGGYIIRQEVCFTLLQVKVKHNNWH